MKIKRSPPPPPTFFFAVPICLKNVQVKESQGAAKITWEESANAQLFKKACPPFSIQRRLIGSQDEWMDIGTISWREKSCLIASQDADTYEFRMTAHFVDRPSSATIAERVQCKCYDFCRLRETKVVEKI